MINGENNTVSNGASDNIPELSGTSSTSNQNPDTPELASMVSFNSPPFWTWVYFDHEKNMDFVCVAVVALCGITDIRFEIAQDGTKVFIRYSWPTAIFRAAELFQKARDGNLLLSMQHPKVNAFVANTLENGISYNSSPTGEIAIQLPSKVQRNPGTWKKEALTMNETKIILLEFSAQPKEIIIEDADTSIVFK